MCTLKPSHGYVYIILSVAAKPIADSSEDQKMKAHVEKAVKHCAPRIVTIVNKYNAKQKEMLKE